MKTIYKLVMFFAVLATFTACDNYLTLYPEDDIVDDKYWEDGNKVQSVVAAAYRYLADDNVLRKMVYWGELRSDNEDYSTGGTDEENLHEANLLSSNSIVKWDGFYKVINICNNFIAKAPGVRDKDANFTEERLHSYMAEAYSIRAICYFYLIRAFGDVPYVTTPSKSEQTDYNVPQSSADSILVALIGDMENYAVQWAPEDWDTEAHSHGRITVNAVRALLADMYLWKASDVSNADAAADYQKCVDYCNAILNDGESTLVFSEGEDMYYSVFGQGNASENIFELNYVTNGLANNVTSQLYGNTSKSTTAHFNPSQSLYNSFSESDSRRYQYLQLNYSTSGSNINVTSYKIFKYEGVSAPGAYGLSNYSYRSSSSYANWILSRLADGDLREAEALAELARLHNDQTLADRAMDYLNVIHRRATSNLEELTAGTISDVEDAVLAERRREFCFEGKRWFDLLRKVRREGSTAKALSLLVSARSGDTKLFEARLSTIDAWYLPISKSEMNANPRLHQNNYYTLKEQ